MSIIMPETSNVKNEPVDLVVTGDLKSSLTSKPSVVVLKGIDKKVYVTLFVVVVLAVVLSGIAVIFLGRLVN